MKRHENQPANSRGKLTPKQVRAIREKGAKTNPKRPDSILAWAELGAKYGISGGQARKVASGKSYQWVD